MNNEDYRHLEPPLQQIVRFLGQTRDHYGGYWLVARPPRRSRRPIQHTVRYTELAPTRFKDFWRD
jgi:hypothetical protein